MNWAEYTRQAIVSVQFAPGVQIWPLPVSNYEQHARLHPFGLTGGPLFATAIAFKRLREGARYGA
jgi:hypothetical protein